MSFIDHYETQLVDAGRRRMESRWRNRIARWLRVPRHRNAAAVLAALLVGAPAAAAVAGWNPFDDAGRKPDSSPTTSVHAPVPKLTLMLAPLRRPQSPADRGQATSLAARGFWNDVGGVQLDYIRVLDEARGIVMVPVKHFGLSLQRHAGPPPRPADFADAVCLYIPGTAGQARRPCYTATRIADGFAISTESGGAVIGIVPDGVARVRLSRRGRSSEASVHDNLFVADSPSPSTIDWIAPTGHTIKHIELTQPQPQPGRP
jgi:hypothetical protein